jgi:hypothetical protein
MRVLSVGLALSVVPSFVARSFATEILNLDSNQGVIAPGGNVTSWTNSGTAGGAFTQTNSNAAPTLVTGPNGTQVIQFAGVNSLRDLSFGQSSVPEATVFIVAAVSSNPGSYRAFAAGASASADDFASGFNIDQGANSTSSFNAVNVESAKAGGGGGMNLLGTSYSFGTYHVLQINMYNGGYQLFVDGSAQGSRSASNAPLDLTDLWVGSRHFGNSDRGFFNGNIGAVQIYSSQLTSLQTNHVGLSLGREFGISTTYVPEPSTMVLTAIAGAGLALASLRRSRHCKR